MDALRAAVPGPAAPAAVAPREPLVKTGRGTILVDLTLELTNGMPVSAPYPAPVVLPYASHEDGGGTAFHGPIIAGTPGTIK